MRKFWFFEPTIEIASDLFTKYPLDKKNFISLTRKQNGNTANFKLYNIDPEIPFAEASTNIQYRILNVQGKINNKLEGFTKVTISCSSNQFKIYSTYSTDKYKHDPKSWDVIPQCRSTLQTEFLFGNFKTHLGVGLRYDNDIAIFTGIKNSFGSLFVQSELSETDTKFNIGFHTQIGIFTASKIAVDNNHLRELSFGYTSKTDFYKAFCIVDVLTAKGAASCIFNISKSLKFAGNISFGIDQNPTGHICSIYKKDGAKLRTTITPQELLIDVQMHPKNWLGINLSTRAFFTPKAQPVHFGWSLEFNV